MTAARGLLVRAQRMVLSAAERAIVDAKNGRARYDLDLKDEQNLCLRLWEALHDLKRPDEKRTNPERGDERGSLSEELLLVMSELALIVYPQEAHSEAFLSPIRSRPDNDRTKARFLDFEGNFRRTVDRERLNRRNTLSESISCSAFHGRLIGDQPLLPLREKRPPAAEGPGLWAHESSAGWFDYIVVVHPRGGGDAVVEWLEIDEPDAQGRPRASFSIDGLWGGYTAGREWSYANGHEEGAVHEKGVDWEEWLFERLSRLLKDSDRDRRSTPFR